MSGIPILQLLVSTRTGGGPRHVHDLALGIRARGFDPLVAGPRDGLLFDRFGDAGIETIELAVNSLAPSVTREAGRLIRARGVRLVHSHGKGAGLHGRVAARLCGVPAVHTHHGIHYEGYSAPARAAYLGLERWLSRSTAAVINVSRSQEAEGLALGLFAATRSRVIPNGVDVDRLTAHALDRDAARAALGLGGSDRVIGCAARFDPVKGLDLLLRAAARLADPTLRVVLIGAGDEALRMRTLAGALGLSGRARFPGEIPEAARLFRAFDLYVSPSRKEGMPLAVLEAMALGLPVVATDIAGHREVLGDDSPGLTEPTEEDLGGALGRWLADPSVAHAAGLANRARVTREFGAQRMIDATARVYREMLRM